jgi:hypothetical protein
MPRWAQIQDLTVQIQRFGERIRVAQLLISSLQCIGQVVE